MAGVAGGEGGIRTHGTLRLTQLATERFRPLSHLSNQTNSITIE